MGAPISQPKRTADDVLRGMVRSSSHKISEADACLVGLDFELLEAAYDDVKPRLDYLSGYKPLESFGDIRGFRGEAWDAMLGRHGQLGQHQQCLIVLGSKLYAYGASVPRDRQEAYLIVWLSRQGKWILLYSIGRGGLAPMSEEHLSVYENLHDMLNALRELRFDEYSVSHEHYSNSNPADKLTLALAFSLRRVLDYTIEERKSRLNDMQRASETITERLSCIKFR